ncbi:MAG: hypothetical protein AAF443_03930 [Chlamydiota bacterium]
MRPVSSPIPKITKPSFLDTERPSNYSWVDLEYGKKTALPLIKGYFSGLFNQNTILLPTVKKWDQRRLENSIERYRSIGAKSILLHTETGDKIHSCYFDAKQFQTSLANIGGEIKQYHVTLNNPLLRSAEPIKIKTPERSMRGIKFSYNKGRVRDRANLFKLFHPHSYVMCYVIDETNGEQIKTAVIIIERKGAPRQLFFSKEQITRDDTFNPAFSTCFPEVRTGSVACFNHYNTKDLNQIEAATVLAHDKKSNANVPIGNGFTIPIAVLNNQPTLIKDIESLGYTALKDTLEPITSNTVSARDNQPSLIAFINNTNAYENLQNRRLIIKKDNDNKEQAEKIKTTLKPLFRIERYPAFSLFSPLEKAFRKITAIKLKNSSRQTIEAIHIPSQVLKNLYSYIYAFAHNFNYRILDAKNLQRLSHKAESTDVILVKRTHPNKQPLTKSNVPTDALTNEACRDLFRFPITQFNCIREEDKTLFFENPVSLFTYLHHPNANEFKLADILLEDQLDEDLITYVRKLADKENFPEKDYRNITVCLKDNKHAAGLRNKKKAVVISQHQIGTMHSEYSRQEILAFLRLGINVFTYDYAGKGKSQGRSSAASFQETFKIIGQFLMEKQQFDEQDICFKGLCTGGIISLKAAEMFKKASIWLDQTPVNFYTIGLNIIKKPTWLKIVKLWPLNFFFQLFARLFTPPYDAKKSLLKNEGKHFYTIGIPNIKGEGGDTIVPKEEQEKMKALLKKEDNRKNNHYIEIEGAIHGSPWLNYPQVFKSIKKNRLWTVETI